jgi:cytochrome c
MIMKRMHLFVAVTFATLAVGTNTAFAQGSPARGQRIFGACAACHSLQPGQNMTGPSLAGVWDRKAGSLADFSRYSPALQSSAIVWNDKTLDAWIADPQHLVPGNQMTFAGIKDSRQRSDLIAFLKEATQPGTSTAQRGGPTGGMGGMMGGGQAPDLKHAEPALRVRAISYCKDTYVVTTADGQTHKFWERNLRLKTDSGGEGPEKHAPALIPAGMMGDRADVIFSDPAEISPLIASQC